MWICNYLESKSRESDIEMEIRTAAYMLDPLWLSDDDIYGECMVSIVIGFWICKEGLDLIGICYQEIN